MAQILSQDEIDALLGGIDKVGEAAPVDSSGGSASQTSDGIQPYDFRTQARSSRARLPGFDVILDQFNRGLRGTLSSQLRLYVDSVPAPIETLTFQEFLKRVPVPGSIHIVKMEPLRGHILMVLDPQMVFCIVEIFLGATKLGQARIEGREFTAIEQRLILRMVNALLSDLERAWQHVMPVKVNYVRGEINPQFAKIVQDDEAVLISRFQLEIEEVRGFLSLCIPMGLLQPIKARLQQSFHGEDAVDHVWRNQLVRNVASSMVEGTVYLGNATMTGADLMDLTPGDIIQLDTGLDDFLALHVGGQPKFQVMPGVYKGHRAVRVEKTLINN